MPPSGVPRWPQVLVDLTEVFVGYFRRDDSLTEQEARIEAEHLVERVADHLGGEPFYLPKADVIRRHRRDQALLCEFNGRNERSLARRYGLSERYVRRLIERERSGE